MTISNQRFDAAFSQPQNLFSFVDIAGGVSAANTARLQAALRSFPDAKLQTKSQFKANQEQGLNTLLNLLYVLLSLSIVVSLFGIVNTLVLTVFERTRELGMLRAVGMSRRQVRRMIRHESIITALLGAAFGIPLGVVLALLVGAAIKFSAFTIPVGTLVVFVIAAIVAGHAGGDLPGAAGGAAQRAGGPAVRVSGIRGGEFQWEFRGMRCERRGPGAKLRGVAAGAGGQTPDRSGCPNPRSVGGVVHLDRSERPECPFRPAGRELGHWSRLATRPDPGPALSDRRPSGRPKFRRETLRDLRRVGGGTSQPIRPRESA